LRMENLGGNLIRSEPRGQEFDPISHFFRSQTAE
jgi:hypothetical protein